MNEALLKADLAWHFKKHDKNPEWAKMEADARAAHVCLWVDYEPTAPWDWRQVKRVAH